LLYPWLFSRVLLGENGLLPGKFDYVLTRIDNSLGVSATSIALPLQGILRIPLRVVYQATIPMMLCWFLITHSKNRRCSLLIAYVTELLIGPILYAIVPACGPIYAFGAQWLHPPTVQANQIQLSGMPNAFPSLHIATAFVLVLFAERKLWRWVSLTFLVGTALATLSTGEHYIVDLIPGLIFGCFAESLGYLRVRSALVYLGVVLFWSFAVRFEYPLLIVHPGLLRSFAALTVAFAIFAVFKEWKIPAVYTPEPDIARKE
jgi:hypothetical protein